MYYAVVCSCGDVVLVDSLNDAEQHIELETNVLIAHGVDMSKHVMTIEERDDKPSEGESPYRTDDYDH